MVETGDLWWVPRSFNRILSAVINQIGNPRMSLEADNTFAIMENCKNTIWEMEITFISSTIWCVKVPGAYEYCDAILVFINMNQIHGPISHLHTSHFKPEGSLRQELNGILPITHHSIIPIASRPYFRNPHEIFWLWTLGTYPAAINYFNHSQLNFALILVRWILTPIFCSSYMCKPPIGFPLLMMNMVFIRLILLQKGNILSLLCLCHLSPLIFLLQRTL